MSRVRQSWPTTLRQAAAEFARGAFAPSVPAIVGAILLAGTLFLGCVFFLNPKFIARCHSGWFMRSPTDNYAQLSVESLKLAENPPQAAVCALIGDSLVREAISSRAELEQLISAKAGRPVSVRFLTADGISLWEMLAVADGIRPKMTGVVAIEITPYNLAITRKSIADRCKQMRLAIDWPAENDERRLLKLRPRKSGRSFFLDHYWFFAARIEVSRNLFTGPMLAPDHELENEVAWGANRWRRQRDRITQWESTYEAERDANMAAYRRMIDRLRESGRITPVLLEGPQNPRLDELTPEEKRLRQIYRADAPKLSQEASVEYWDLVRDAKLGPRDFLDYGHVRSAEGRRRFTAALADRFAAALLKNNLLEESRP